MENVRPVVISIFLVAILVACHSNSSESKYASTEVFETAIFMAETKIAETQENVFSPTPSYSPSFFATATIIPESNIIVTPKPDQQVYIDPEGWYAVNFPVDMKSKEDTPGFFYNSYNQLETGYLPAMGTMSYARNVCAWIANVVEEEPEKFIIQGRAYSPIDCSVSTQLEENASYIRYEIFENPSADPDHRFAYVKTRGSPKHSFSHTFSWLKPTHETEFIHPLPTLSPAEIAEWESIAPFLQNVSVTEYDLPPGSHAHKNDSLSRYVPEEALPDWGEESSNSETEADEKDVVTLISLGYDVETEMVETSSGQYPRKKLYRDGRLLFDYVFDVSVIYNFSTAAGSLTAFVVTTRSMSGQYNAFLIQDDAVIAWNSSHQDPPFAPILYQDEPLWLKVSKDWNHVRVLKSNSESVEVLYSFSVCTEPMYSTQKFTTWDGHWVWAVHDFLIQDGKIRNEELGFQEIFNWRLIDNKPAYLFRKDGRVGFSYDGKIIPLEYQNVARYWWSNEPYIGKNSAHFFAEREGVWYYVVVKFR